jgi:hypothetical protein
MPPDRRQNRFVRATDIPVTEKNCRALAHDGGRSRWRTENEGFRGQKHEGFAMEHAYAKRPRTAKNLYRLLQVAHLDAVRHLAGSRRRSGPIPLAFGPSHPPTSAHPPPQARPATPDAGAGLFTAAFAVTEWRSAAARCYNRPSLCPMAVERGDRMRRSPRPGL